MLAIAAHLLVKILHTNSFPALSVFLQLGSGSVCSGFIRYLASAPFPVQSLPVSTKTFCFQVTNSMENMPHYPGGTFSPPLLVGHISNFLFRSISHFLPFLSCTLFYYPALHQEIQYNKPVCKQYLSWSMILPRRTISTKRNLA